MRAGLLRTSASIERAAETQDASGAVIQTWATLATRHMDIRPMSGRESPGGQQTVGEVTHKVRLRYDATIADLTPKDRLSIGGRILDILTVRNIQERSREYELLCREVV